MKVYANDRASLHIAGKEYVAATDGTIELPEDLVHQALSHGCTLEPTNIGHEDLGPRDLGELEEVVDRAIGLLAKSFDDKLKALATGFDKRLAELSKAIDKVKAADPDKVAAIDKGVNDLAIQTTEQFDALGARATALEAAVADLTKK